MLLCSVKTAGRDFAGCILLANTSIWATHIPNGPTKIHANAITARTNRALCGTDATFIVGVHAG